MKKGVCLLALLCAFLLAATGCDSGRLKGVVRGEGSLPPVPGSARGAGQEESRPEENRPLEDSSLYIADAPLYRGTVTEYGASDGRLQFTLESAEGVDFGYPSIRMETDHNTRANFPLEELAVGDHIEAYYGDRNDGLPPLVIAANRLLPAADTVFNGEVASYEPDGEYPRLELRPLDGGGNVIFNIGEDTKMYVDQSGLEAGVKVNIYHRGFFTRSIPPQGSAMEIRYYHEP